MGKSEGEKENSNKMKSWLVGNGGRGQENHKGIDEGNVIEREIECEEGI